MLEWTGERYLPYVDPSVCGVEIHYEHLHRYAFASPYVNGKIVLDLASGEGYGSFILARSAKQVIGIDIDPAAVEHASSRYRRDNLDFRSGSITDVPVPGKHIFDVIICYEAIEHINLQDLLLSEVKRLLKPDGIFIVSTPNKNLYSDVLGNVNPFHKKELDYPEFVELMHKNFTHVHILGQSTLNGSHIYPIEKEETSCRSKFLLRTGENVFALKSTISEADNKKYSLYFIAVASDAATNNLNTGSYLVDQANTEIAFLSNTIVVKDGTIQSLQEQITTEKQTSQNLTVLKDSLNKTLAVKDQLLADLEEQRSALRGRIEQITNDLSKKGQLADRLAAENTGFRKEIASNERELQHLRNITVLLKNENNALKSSISYRILNKFHTAIIEPFFPPHTRRRELYELSLKGGRMAVSEGIGRTFSEYKKYRLSKQSPVPGPEKRNSSSLPAARPCTPGPGVNSPPLKQPEREAGREKDPVAYIFSQMNTKSREYVPITENPANLTTDDIRFIAFYLPQFHPIPENDLWWGKGFTEWTNVTKSLPQFIGHYQPHRPDDLGYYDLRLPEVQKRQVELARLYGIYGFCFHYYWFEGKRLLEKPLNQYLDHPEFTLPFCVCWANENWTRRWDGMENEILISQTHDAENDIRFIQDLEPVLRDPRYIRIHNKPLIIVYRATLFPKPTETVQRWREYCRSCGIGEIYLVAALCFGCRDPSAFGFDAGVEFPPHSMADCNNITREKTIINPEFSGNIYDYKEFVQSKKYLYPTTFRLFKTVAPGWDNTARRSSHASIYDGANPREYKNWLRDVSHLTRETLPEGEQFVFINAWNEWAEGTHLEPDMRFGYGYLQATAEVVAEMRLVPRDKKKIIIVSHDAHFHGAQLLALNLARVLKQQFHYDVITLIKIGGVLEKEFRCFSRVYVLDREFPDHQSQEQLIAALATQGVTIAIGNTVVSGDIVELLAKNNIKTISLIHELPGIIRQFRQEDNLQKISGNAHRIVFPSRYVRDAVQKITHIEDDRCLIAPQGLYSRNTYKENIPEARRLLREKLSLPAHARIVLGVGYADHRKGADIFTDVAGTVIPCVPDCYFIWVGHEDMSFMPGIHARIREENLHDHVRFVGIQEDVSVFYAGADVFLLTSREDPFPSVVLESLDVGTPVIGFEGAGGFADILSRSGGILVPLPDVKAMADNLCLLLRDEKVRTGLGRDGEILIRNEYRFVDYVYGLLETAGHTYKKVSVILPNYNYEHFLPARLESIVNQNYPVYEILFLDDKSSDKSLRIAREFAESSPVDFYLFTNDTNSGSVFRQWAKGMAVARGDYCWIAEADDLSENTFLSTVMTGFEDPDVILSYSQSQQMDENGRILSENYLQYTADVDPLKWRSDYVSTGRRRDLSCPGSKKYHSQCVRSSVPES